MFKLVEMLDVNNSDQKYRQSILEMVPPRIANRTYNRINSVLIQVTFGPFECIRESRVCFLKTLVDSTNVMSIPLMYESYMVKYGQTRSSTDTFVYKVSMYISIFINSISLILSPVSSTIVG